MSATRDARGRGAAVHASAGRQKRSAALLFALALGATACAAEAGDPLEEVEALGGEAVALADGGETELATPGRAGEPRRGWLLGEDGEAVEIGFEEIDGEFVFEGDILLAPSQVQPLDEEPGEPDEGVGSTAQPLSIVRKAWRWPGGVVPYKIAKDLPNKDRVRDAIAHWEQTTPIRFVQRGAQHADFVVFRKGTGCSAHIGRVGGKQVVNLADNCSKGNVIHEIGHAVGLFHEQSRLDRSDHVRIKWDNVHPSYKSAFEKHGATVGRDPGAYDYQSIMHYGSFFFSKNGKPTIVKKGGGIIEPNRKALSYRDKKWVREAY